MEHHQVNKRCLFEVKDRIEKSLIEPYYRNLNDTDDDYKLARTFKSAKLQDPDRIKGLMQYCEEGDPIKVTPVPGDDDICIDTLRIPEESFLGVENEN